MKISPQNKKYLVWGGAAAAAAIILYFVLRKGTTASGDSYDPTGNGTATPESPENFDAKAVAEELWNAMNQFGTDEEAIVYALRKVNQEQFGQVVKAFGQRAYNDNAGSDFSGPFYTPPSRPLAYWLKSELSASEYNVYKLKYPKYL